MSAPKFYTAAGITASFGLESEGLGFLVESFGYDVQCDKTELYDENGALVLTHRTNKRASIKISGVGTTSLGVGDILSSLVNTAGGQLDGTILVDQVVKTKSGSSFEKVDLTATQYDISLTASSGS